MIRLIVGLGNPGQQYEKTRHNAGFWFADQLVEKFGGNWQSDKRFNGYVASIVISGNSVALLKPMTYMNKSGLSVGSYLRYFHIDLSNILVVHDELDFLPGIIKVKKNGGHAGHNGLRDIIAHLKTNEFPRLRIGIGRPSERQSVADFVLSVPSNVEQDKMQATIESVVARIDVLVDKDIDFAMNALNAAN
jgi:peptidyl-tRNA hydrolase, PTH1 family